MAQTVHPCRFHENNAGSTTLYLKKDLADAVRDCFPAKVDFSAVFDPKKETLTIFKATPP